MNKYRSFLMLLAAILIISGCAATSIKKQSTLKSFKHLSHYKLGDFQPAEAIRYFKITTHEYAKNTGKAFIWCNLQDAATPEACNGSEFEFDADSFKKLSRSQIREISKLRPTVATNNNKEIIHYTAPDVAEVQNPRANIIYYVKDTDTEGSVGIINNKTQLRHFLGDIDTEAEIALLMWSENKGNGCYGKTTKGYEIYTKHYYQPAYIKTQMDSRGNILNTQELSDKDNPCK